MRKNKLGFLGLVTENFGFYGFFGFFGFFSTFWGIGSDERIEKNIDRACRNAFVFITITSAFSLAYIASFKAVEALPLALLPPFAGIVLFVFSYIYYDRSGD